MKARRIVFQSIGALLLISQTGYSAQKSVADVEPKVKTTLEKMVKYLESVENLAFTATSTTEDVSSTLQKLQSDTSLEAVIQYPNKVYFKKSGNEQMSLWFDGQTVTILDRTAKKYSKVALVGSLQDLVNKLDDLGIEAPLAGIELWADLPSPLRSLHAHPSIGWERHPCRDIAQAEHCARIELSSLRLKLRSS